MGPSAPLAREGGRAMRSSCAFILLVVCVAIRGQETPAPSEAQAVDPGPMDAPAIRIEGSLPASLKVKVTSAPLGGVRLVESAKRPTRVAPSAIAYGHADFSSLPANLSFYAGLTEKGNVGPRAVLDTLEARFKGGPRATMAFDVTQGEVLVGQTLARKLGVGVSKEATARLPAFALGSVTCSGVMARIVSDGDLPSDSVDGVLSLTLFSGLGVFWESAAERITLYGAGDRGPTRASGSFSVPVRWDGGALLLKTLLQEKVEGFLLLNPAQPHSAIEAAAARRAGVPMMISGDVGKNELRRGGLAEEARIRLGTTQVTIRSAPVLNVAAELPEGCIGILGRETFSLFNCYIEPGVGAVVLMPAGKTQGAGR